VRSASSVSGDSSWPRLRPLWIEDVVTSGRADRVVPAAARTAGRHRVSVLCVVTAKPGREHLAAEGLRCAHCSTMSKLLGEVPGPAGVALDGAGRVAWAANTYLAYAALHSISRTPPLAERAWASGDGGLLRSATRDAPSDATTTHAQIDRRRSSRIEDLLLIISLVYYLQRY